MFFNGLIFLLLWLAKILGLVATFLLLSEVFSLIDFNSRNPIAKDIANILNMLGLIPLIFGFGVIVFGVRTAIASEHWAGGWIISIGGFLVLGLAQWRGVASSWVGISLAYAVIGLIIVISSLFTQSTAAKKEE